MTQPPGARPDRGETRRRAALDDLADLCEPGESVAGSALARTARRAGAHFSARDAEAGDAIELWGRRIGRTLGLLACIGLGIYLYLTYFR